MKVAVYVSAVPSKTKNDFKRQLLHNFATGVRLAGDEVTIVDDLRVIEPADIAVLQGWIGMKRAPHLEQRHRVIEYQRLAKAHTLVIDSNLFGFLDPADKDRYLRYSLNGIFPTTAHYFTNKIDRSRWPTIKAHYRFEERAWNFSGSNVLICCQRDGGWSMDGVSVLNWLSVIIPKIREHTNRPIVIRPHPGSLKVLPAIRQIWPDITISQQDIRQDLDRAWCTITYNSSPGVASLLWGVPTFITDPLARRSQAYGMGATDLNLIDQPPRPDREEFYHRLSQCHFATANLCDGMAWQFMRDRLI